MLILTLYWEHEKIMEFSNVYIKLIANYYTVPKADTSENPLLAALLQSFFFYKQNKWLKRSLFTMKECG